LGQVKQQGRKINFFLSWAWLVPFSIWWSSFACAGVQIMPIIWTLAHVGLFFTSLPSSCAGVLVLGPFPICMARRFHLSFFSGLRVIACAGVLTLRLRPFFLTQVGFACAGVLTLRLRPFF
jgi:hypothetical protein